VYFSFLTFTTIGFKDIAVNSLAKAIVIIEIITFYLTIGAGIKYIIHRKKEDEELTRQYFRTKQFKKNRS
jgi:hypothetical protein